MSPPQPATNLNVAVLSNRVDTLEDSVKSVSEDTQEIKIGLVELRTEVKGLNSTMDGIGEVIEKYADRTEKILEKHSDQIADIHTKQQVSSSKIKMFAVIVLGSGGLGAGAAALLEKLF